MQFAKLYTVLIKEGQINLFFFKDGGLTIEKQQDPWKKNGYKVWRLEQCRRGRRGNNNLFRHQHPFFYWVFKMDMILVSAVCFNWFHVGVSQSLIIRLKLKLKKRSLDSFSLLFTWVLLVTSYNRHYMTIFWIQKQTNSRKKQQHMVAGQWSDANLAVNY